MPGWHDPSISAKVDPMSADDALAEAPKPSAVRVFLRRFLLALLFAAPSIGSWVSSNVIYLRIDELERPLKKEAETRRVEMSDLERLSLIHI